MYIQFKRGMYRQLLVASVLLWCVAVNAEPLLKTTTSWDGSDLQYPAGDAEITSILLALPEGKTAPWHCHPVPTLGFVKQGKILVETADGSTTVLSEGEPAVEVMNTLHRGTAVDGAVEIIVFYAGAVGVPTTVMADDPLAEQYCR